MNLDLEQNIDPKQRIALYQNNCSKLPRRYFLDAKNVASWNLNISYEEIMIVLDFYLHTS